MLIKNTPVLVTPTKYSAVIQNTMATSNDDLLVSTHGDPEKAWMSIEFGENIKFSEPTYLLQKAKDTWTFPVLESD